MHIGIPQAIYLAMMFTGIGISVARFGERKEGRYDVTDVLIAPAIVLSVLYWGGFFD